MQAIENPDSVGWNPKLRIWEAPMKKGFDKNQRGFGVDIVKNGYAKVFFAEHPRPGYYLTDDEERLLRYRYLDYLQKVYDKHVSSDLQISDKKKAMALGIMYHGFGPRLWSDNGDGLHDAFFNGTDYEFEDQITKFYVE